MPRHQPRHALPPIPEQPAPTPAGSLVATSTFEAPTESSPIFDADPDGIGVVVAAEPMLVPVQPLTLLDIAKADPSAALAIYDAMKAAKLRIARPWVIGNTSSLRAADGTLLAEVYRVDGEQYSARAFEEMVPGKLDTADAQREWAEEAVKSRGYVLAR